MEGIKGYAHVAIKVRDLDRTLAFYVGKLGFAEMMRLHNKDGSTWLVYLRMTDTQYLEVFPGADSDRAPGSSSNGVNHMCLETDDLKSLVANLEAVGVALIAPLKLGLDGNYQAWIQDPDGNRIELMQMERDSMQAKAIARMRGEAVPA